MLSQTGIDEKLLFGRWELVKVETVEGTVKKDLSRGYPYFVEFKMNKTFTEVIPKENTVIVGNYSLVQSTLTYSNLVQTVKYPDGKVKVPDYTFKTSKPKMEIQVLTKSSLILLNRHGPKSEGSGDYYYHYVKK